MRPNDVNFKDFLRAKHKNVFFMEAAILKFARIIHKVARLKIEKVKGQLVCLHVSQEMQDGGF